MNAFTRLALFVESYAKKKKIRFEITLRYLFILINTDKKQIILENI